MGAIKVHMFTHLFPLTVQKCIYVPVSNMHAGSFRVFVIHRTPTWTTGSLTCVRDHSCACYTHGGWAHRQRVSTFLTRKNSQFVLVLLTGFEPRSFGSLSPTVYQVSHPVTPYSRSGASISYRSCIKNSL